MYQPQTLARGIFRFPSQAGKPADDYATVHWPGRPATHSDATADAVWVVSMVELRVRAVSCRWRGER